MDLFLHESSSSFQETLLLNTNLSIWILKWTIPMHPAVSWIPVFKLSEYQDVLTIQKMKFSIKHFFSKCDQICRKLRVQSHLLKKSLMENFIFCAVILEGEELNWIGQPIRSFEGNIQGIPGHLYQKKYFKPALLQSTFEWLVLLNRFLWTLVWRLYQTIDIAIYKWNLLCLFSFNGLMISSCHEEKCFIKLHFEGCFSKITIISIDSRREKRLLKRCLLNLAIFIPQT